MTDIRKEFQELLINYPCSDFQSDEQNYENVLIKTDWILKHIPKKLYRFRPCSEYAITAVGFSSSSFLLSNNFSGRKRSS